MTLHLALDSLEDGLGVRGRVDPDDRCGIERRGRLPPTAPARGIAITVADPIVIGPRPVFDPVVGALFYVGLGEA